MFYFVGITAVDVLVSRHDIKYPSVGSIRVVGVGWVSVGGLEWALFCVRAPVNCRTV